MRFALTTIGEHRICVDEQPGMKMKTLTAKSFRLLAATVLLLAAVAALAETEGAEDTLRIDIRIPDTSYVYGQRIYVEVIIKNLTDRRLSIVSPWQQGQLVLVVDDSGSLKRGIRGEGSPARLHTLSLEARDSLYYTDSIQNDLDSGNSSQLRLSRIVPGHHRVSAFLGLSARSDSMLFQVIQPDSAEQLELNLLDACLIDSFDRTKLSAIIEKLRQLLRESSGTVYRLEALKAIWSVKVRLNDQPGATTAASDFIHEYPDHPASFEVMHRMCRFYLTDEREKYLRHLIDEFPSNRVSDYARDAIEKK